jgi:biofilm PGA synthesis N-glycosyltransferase PgaC
VATLLARERIEVEVELEPSLALEAYIGAAPRRARLYLTVRQRFVLATGMSCAWLAISAALAQPWAVQLGGVIGDELAWAVIALLALVPGFLNAHLFSSLLLDRQRPLANVEKLPAVTVLIAAWNERGSIAGTLQALSRVRYPGPWAVIVVDDGSSDGTSDATRACRDLVPYLRVVRVPHRGKAAALNIGLELVQTPVLVTIDADTALHPDALRRVVTRLITAPRDTAAVAGSVLARNSRANFLTRIQEWDYLLAIGSVKRQQALYQGTLVAQGAFSAYKTEAVRAARGWPFCIGEDIVLTWALQKAGHRIGFEPTAIAFTTVPSDVRRFVRQRRRWARGMIEGLARHGDLLWRRPRLTGFFVFIDALFPLLDTAYALLFLPGIALALFGYYFIAGPMTLLVIPLVLLVTAAMRRRQDEVFSELGLRYRRNRLGFLAYVVGYQAVLAPIAVFGYAQELLRLPKRW